MFTTRHVSCHVQHVMCHLSCVTGHVFCFLFFYPLPIFGANWWRVCYQKGLTRLVSMLIQNVLFHNCNLQHFFFKHNCFLSCGPFKINYYHSCFKIKEGGWKYHIEYKGLDCVTSFLNRQQTYKCHLTIIALWQIYQAIAASWHQKFCCILRKEGYFGD